MEQADAGLLREMVKLRIAERAFVRVVVESYVRGVSTRRVEGLV